MNPALSNVRVISMPGLYASQSESNFEKSFAGLLPECYAPFEPREQDPVSIVCPVLSCSQSEDGKRLLQDGLMTLATESGRLVILSPDELVDSQVIPTHICEARAKIFDHDIEDSGISTACWAAMHMLDTDDDLSVFVTPHGAITIFHPVGAFCPGGPKTTADEAYGYLRRMNEARRGAAYIYLPDLPSAHEKIAAIKSLPNLERLTQSLMATFLPKHPAFENLTFERDGIDEVQQ